MPYGGRRVLCGGSTLRGWSSGALPAPPATPPADAVPTTGALLGTGAPFLNWGRSVSDRRLMLLRPRAATSWVTRSGRAERGSVPEEAR
jgi:hypothetical protein